MTITQKQKLFADAYLKTGVATVAMEEAGYSTKYAGTNASKLLNNTNVQSYLENRRKQLDPMIVADIEEIQVFWSGTMRDEQVEMNHRLKASEYLGKTAGMFIDKVQVDTQQKESKSEIAKQIDDVLNELIGE